MSDSSYQELPAQPSSSDDDDVDSLPSTSASTTSISPSDEDYQSDAEREWRESLQQLELVLTMVLVPYLGKYFGRKAAYYGESTPAHATAAAAAARWSKRNAWLTGHDDLAGWAKFMEWKYPVTIEITNSKLFKGAGAIEAAASL
ncbi:hypothetical protein MBLNU459_g0651t2 [Dothideomycetes sp. NU459]